MPPPRFETCPHCGRGYGSMSLPIHMPQCVKLTQASHGRRQSLQDREKRASTQSISTRTQSTRRSSLPPVNQRPQETVRECLTALVACRRCGRKFSKNRVDRHESVCIANCPPRAKFDSRAKRQVSEGMAYVRPSRAVTHQRVSNDRQRGRTKPQSTWRQQHQEFVDAVRAARQQQRQRPVVNTQQKQSIVNRQMRTAVRTTGPTPSEALRRIQAPPGIRPCIVPGSPEARRLCNWYGSTSSSVDPFSNENTVRVIGSGPVSLPVRRQR